MARSDANINWKCLRNRDCGLISVAVWVTNGETRSREGRQQATPAGGASAVPAGGGSSPRSRAASGHQPAGTMTGTRGARCNRATGAGGDPRRLRRLVREAWPGSCTIGMRHSLGQSRGGTPRGERADASRVPRPYGAEEEKYTPPGVPLPFSLVRCFVAERDRDDCRPHRRRHLTTIKFCNLLLEGRWHHSGAKKRAARTSLGRRHSMPSFHAVIPCRHSMPSLPDLIRQSMVRSGLAGGLPPRFICHTSAWTTGSSPVVTM